MKISYAITVYNELEEIKRLIPFLLEHKRPEDEIVVLWDENGDFKVWEYVISIPGPRHFRDYFNKNFAEWKNKLSLICKGDYIFQIDADEYPHEYLIESLPEILETNSQVEVYTVPRVNTVDGLTQEHIQKWGWNMNQDGWINFPDYQWRIYKNTPDIKWKNKVHEILDGYKTIAQLPAYEDLALYHPKTIEKQEKAVRLYQIIDPTVKEKI
jgi:glycosyltransferase involved in cell wall biosynthesis